MELLHRYSKPSDLWRKTDGLLERLKASDSSKIIIGPTPRRHKLPQRLTTQQRDALVASYQAGVPSTALMREYRLSKGSVLAILHEASVKMRRQGLAVEHLAEAARLYEAGWSLARVGVRFGCEAMTVRAALIKLGVSIRPRRGWQSQVQ